MESTSVFLLLVFCIAAVSNSVFAQDQAGPTKTPPAAAESPASESSTEESSAPDTPPPAYVTPDESQQKIESELGRLKITRGEFGLTITNRNGQLLRGGSVFVYQYGREIEKTAFMRKDSYWKLMQDNGINAVRVICFDPWQQSHGDKESNKPYPFADLDKAEDVDALLDDLDFIVDIAAKHSIHVVINYHDTGGYLDPDHTSPVDKKFGSFPYLQSHKYLTRFWDLVAPRYANRPHVAYELMNEPVRWNPESYTQKNLDDIATVAKQVRTLAPETHQILISVANHQSWKPETHSVLRLAQQLTKKGVDFSNASVGIHTYNPRYPKPNSSKEILELMQQFAVVNTEANFPKSFMEELRGGTWGDPDGGGMDGDLMVVQSMERMGVSWFHWKAKGPDEFQKNFIDVLLKDAKAKGYYWR